MDILIGIFIPFIGTTLGSLLVYFLHENLSKKVENIILGFASGIMVAASIWSLLIPSMEMSTSIAWFPATLGFLIGIILFYIIDLLLKKHNVTEKSNLMLAVTIHNIPEGMAVGIAFASYLTGGMSLASCYALSIGIAIQNFPEGSIISFPLLKRGYSKNKSFLYGIISAIFELLGALITLIFTNFISVILPYLLALAAGAMLYVVVIELIPESDSEHKTNIIGFAFGFAIMMILDVTLG